MGDGAAAGLLVAVEVAASRILDVAVGAFARSAGGGGVARVEGAGGVSIRTCSVLAGPAAPVRVFEDGVYVTSAARCRVTENTVASAR